MDNNEFIDYHSEIVVKQFEKRCEALNEKYNSHIDAYYYISHFNQFNSSIKYFSNLQERLYKELKTKFPNLDFGIRGRSKTALSYFTKILDKLQKDPFSIAEVQDQFANKVFLRSINFPIDKIDIYYDKSFIIGSGLYELNLIESDALEFSPDSKNPNYPNTIIIKNPSEQIIIEDNTLLVKDFDTGIMRNIANATLKRSNKDSLIPYLYKMRKVSVDLYANAGFERCKIKDYIATPKKSGYSALQDSFYCQKNNLSLETQYKTQDMERDSKENPLQMRNYYKKGSREINKNTLYQVPHYVLTTSFYDEVQKQVVPISYIPTDDKCLEYTFHITKEAYLEEMVLQAKIQALETKLKIAKTLEERAKLQVEIENLKEKSLNRSSSLEEVPTKE